MIYYVLITGANRGIGLEFCRHYLKEGYKVFATYRNFDSAAELHELQSHYTNNLQLYKLDVCSHDSILQLKSNLNDTPLDLLINNAGIMGARGSFDVFSEKLKDTEGLKDVTQAWLTAFNTNTIGPVMLTLMLLPNLEQGNKKKVVMISSQMGSITNHAADSVTSSSVYRSTKSALNSAANSLAIALRPKNIGIVLLHPGWVMTDMGGKQADIDVHTSVSGMAKVIAESNPMKPLQLLSYQGDILSW